MARWMLVLLARGKLADGTRLFSAATARQSTQIVTPLSPTNPPAELEPLRNSFAGYALGLNVRDYRGHKVWAHGGGLPGYVSQVMMLPDRQLGVTVLTNQESGEVFSSIIYHIVDHYLGASQIDWIDGFRAASARMNAAQKETVTKAQAARDDASTPSPPVAGRCSRLRRSDY